MDYKEKYEQALERARQFSEKPYLEDSAGIVEYIFPELAESEDERIKEEIISFVEQAIDAGYGIIDKERKDKWIAWLEKQGEQPKEHDVCDNCDQQGSCVSPCPMKLVEKQGEQNLANSAKTCKDEKTILIIPKFRVGDVIRPKGSTAEYTIESISGECYHGKGWGLHISCDNDYELVEQKTAEWNEEDEQTFIESVEALEDFGKFELADWLKEHKNKFLKSQNTWKPSGEQIKAVRLARSFVVDVFDEHPTLSEILIELEEQLKKLKEE